MKRTKEIQREILTHFNRVNLATGSDHSVLQGMYPGSFVWFLVRERLWQKREGKSLNEIMIRSEYRTVELTR